jgi:phospho-N-acetylmuramoyl-pentapeptide-transferase
LAHTGKMQIPIVGERDIGPWFIPVAVLIIVFISNAVNITDGLDGLAGWNIIRAFAAYGVMTFLAKPQLSNLMVFCFTMVGACAASGPKSASVWVDESLRSRRCIITSNC